MRSRECRSSIMQLSTLKLRATYQLLSVNGLIVDDRSYS